MKTLKNNYEIHGDICKIFIKHKDEIIEALIDVEDIDKFKNQRIACLWSPRRRLFVVKVFVPKTNRLVYIHRIILNPPENKQVDHINGNTLDNRKCNLRIVSNKENQQNRRINSNNKSGYRGVCWDTKTQKWEATVTLNYKKIILGRFDDVHKAGMVAKEAREKLMPFSTA